ncbi:MAG: hypothetical protein FWE15_02090 [Actinomycetia bacterium]|nr:hypothetical protein [Actinomycetes bacterium]
MTQPGRLDTGESLEAIAGQAARMAALLNGTPPPPAKDYPHGAETGRALADLSAHMTAIGDYLEANPPGSGGGDGGGVTAWVDMTQAHVPGISTDVPGQPFNPLYDPFPIETGSDTALTEIRVAGLTQTVPASVPTDVAFMDQGVGYGLVGIDESFLDTTTATFNVLVTARFVTSGGAYLGWLELAVSESNDNGAVRYGSPGAQAGSFLGEYTMMYPETSALLGWRGPDLTRTSVTFTQYPAVNAGAS